MTPAAQYAQKREEAVALIRQHAPARLQEALIDLLRPAIALSATRADDAEIPIGASKFGGAPDVPDGFEWPTWNEKPLGFLAQINLEEVAAFDVEELLPKSGLLSFFYFLGDDETYAPWGRPVERDGWRVFCFVSEALQSHQPPQNSHGLDERPQIARFEPGIKITVNSELDHFPGVDFEWDSPEMDQLVEFDEKFAHPDGTYHQLLGFANIVQRQPGVEAEANSRGGYEQPNLQEKWPEFLAAYDNWQLLLQLDTDNALSSMWGDMGRLYFMIRREDLAARRFEESWLIMQCT